MKEQEKKRKHRYDGLLTRTAALFTILQDKYAWKEEDFRDFYPDQTIDSAKQQGWVVKY